MTESALENCPRDDRPRGIKRPRILLFGCSNYLGVSRLPQAFHAAGAEVGILCHPTDTLAATGYADRRFVLPRPRLPWRLRVFFCSLCLAFTLGDFKPDLIVPADEPAVERMDSLRRWVGFVPRVARGDLGAVLHRSLPRSDSYTATTTRVANHRLAEAISIPCPQGMTASSLAELRRAARELGPAVVIKAEGTTGGAGVAICRSD